MQFFPFPSYSVVMDDSIFTSTDGSPSPEHQVNAALQSTLKRVSREIHLRKTGWKDCKQPLPPVRETKSPTSDVDYFEIIIFSDV